MLYECSQHPHKTLSSQPPKTFLQMACSLKILRLKPCGIWSLVLYLHQMRTVLLDVEFPAFGYLKRQLAVCTNLSQGVCWRSVSISFVMVQSFFGPDTHLISPEELSQVWLKFSAVHAGHKVIQLTYIKSATAGAAHGMPMCGRHFWRRERVKNVRSIVMSLEICTGILLCYLFTY